MKRYNSINYAARFDLFAATKGCVHKGSTVDGRKVRARDSVDAVKLEEGTKRGQENTDEVSRVAEKNQLWCRKLRAV